MCYFLHASLQKKFIDKVKNNFKCLGCTFYKFYVIAMTYNSAIIGSMILRLNFYNSECVKKI